MGLQLIMTDGFPGGAESLGFSRICVYTMNIPWISGNKIKLTGNGSKLKKLKQHA